MFIAMTIFVLAAEAYNLMQASHYQYFSTGSGFTRVNRLSGQAEVYQGNGTWTAF